MKIELTNQEYKVLNAFLIITQMEYRGRGIHTDTIDSILNKLDKSTDDKNESRYELIDDTNHFNIPPEELERLAKESPQMEMLREQLKRKIHFPFEQMLNR